MVLCLYVNVSRKRAKPEPPSHYRPSWIRTTKEPIMDLMVNLLLSHSL
ncbi:unnamed protein product [Brassica oleracea var. botrytis]